MSEGGEVPVEDRALCDLEISIRQLRYCFYAAESSISDAKESLTSAECELSDLMRRQKEILDELTVIRRMMRVK